MRSFSLFAIAAAAFASVVGAAPALPTLPTGGLPDVKSLAPRGDQPRGCAAILADVKVQVGVEIDVLNYLTPANATAEVITPVLKSVVSIIADATVELQALVGLDVSVIRSSVDGTAVVSVGIIAQLVADILILITGVLAVVLKVVADVKILLDVIVAVALGDCLCGLISAVLALVADLLIYLVPLVLGLVNVILSLGLNVVGSLLTIC